VNDLLVLLAKGACSALFVDALMPPDKKSRKPTLLKEFVTSGISVGVANIVTLPLGKESLAFNYCFHHSL